MCEARCVGYTVGTLSVLGTHSSWFSFFPFFRQLNLSASLDPFTLAPLIGQFNSNTEFCSTIIIELVLERCAVSERKVSYAIINFRRLKIDQNVIPRRKCRNQYMLEFWIRTQKRREANWFGGEFRVPRGDNIVPLALVWLLPKWFECIWF